MKYINRIVVVFLGMAFLIAGCNKNDSTGLGKTHDVTFLTSPPEAGEVSEPSIDYVAGDSIEFRAEPGEEWLFKSWSGVEGDSTSNPKSVIVNSSMTITANFERKEYELTVNTEGEGTVEEVVVQRPRKEYESGTEVKLTANPAEDWEFTQWKGSFSSTENPYTVTVNSPKTITAVFKVSGAGSGVPEAVEPSAGDGSGSNPYEINRVGNLIWMSENPSEMDANFVQTVDIDASGTSNPDFNNGQGLTPIGGNDGFTGNFDGQGHSINNLFINLPSTTAVGMFVRIKGTVEDVHLSNADITGGNYSGAFAGVIETEGASLVNVSLSGQFTGMYRIGGLVGSCFGPDVEISSSYNTADVTGENGVNDANEVGGIVGFVRDCKITNVYNTGDVIGNYNNGGILGKTDGSSLIEQTYNTGLVQQVNGQFQGHNGGIAGLSSGGNVTFQNNFFDDRTSSTVGSGIGGTAKSTSDMMKQSTFTGFDFSSMWAIDEGSSYPYLQSNTQDPKPGSN